MTDAELDAMDAAIDLLAVMFDLYEEGDDVYEEPDEYAGYRGKAVHLSEETFCAIAALLNKHRPRVSADALEGKK